MSEPGPAAIRHRERLAGVRDRIERTAAAAARQEVLAAQHQLLGCAGMHEKLAVRYRATESRHRATAEIFKRRGSDYVMTAANQRQKSQHETPCG